MLAEIRCVYSLYGSADKFRFHGVSAWYVRLYLHRAACFAYYMGRFLRCFSCVVTLHEAERLFDRMLAPLFYSI